MNRLGITPYAVATLNFKLRTTLLKKNQYLFRYYNYYYINVIRK